jgi:hypothetical protein
MNLLKCITFFLYNIILNGLQVTENLKLQILCKILHGTFLQKLSKPICYEKRHINKTVYTVIQACFSSSVDPATRLIHAFLPANIIELVDLQEREKKHILTQEC